MRGHFGIGCYNMKNNLNYGTLFRSAQIFGASYIFLIGRRFKKQSSDTMKAYLHLPLYEYETWEDFKKNIPFDTQVIAIETIGSVWLDEYKHPERACYLLGAEDNGIPKEILRECNKVIQIPTPKDHCSLNVAVAGSIILYDRLVKLK